VKRTGNTTSNGRETVDLNDVRLKPSWAAHVRRMNQERADKVREDVANGRASSDG